MSKEKQVPQILARRVVAQSRLMRIEAVDLKFSNGEQRQFERMKGSGRGAVMIVPCLDEETLLLIREYAAGLHDYQLGFPKGLIDPGETPEEAAQRELKEEVGYGSRQLEFLMEVSLAPQFFSAKMSVFVARDLYPERLPGDEPEPLEKVTWPLNDIDNLLAQPDFSEARSVAALLMLLRNLSEAQ
ncbi:ADP compounds hydrolase NudE [Idiomarina loihiensis]|jgi:ADP-ribose diphosphatase|uniref:ADP compounds hydrolase NudE n=1 Tax=Idiomarina TaxID=135575 RepID=UPI00030DDBDE|nr:MULTISPECIES: ADP compounds hydrolase NudE [unclassified Idiomarina]NWO01778.1 ADP compounds hydrolase NudE [Idiomarinaceae bacterium]PHQ93109.1 MAG: ADP compounds hydrolase NudE [Idiomarina sp.]TDO48737.1 ADP-ribose diphosphatase [Idiomarina sp. 017G]|tara:strand:+ start:106 stop:663 length:558 start_codon:yes stop_codon:yes gene_type:complete